MVLVNRPLFGKIYSSPNCLIRTVEMVAAFLVWYIREVCSVHASIDSMATSYPKRCICQRIAMVQAGVLLCCNLLQTSYNFKTTFLATFLATFGNISIQFSLKQSELKVVWTLNLRNSHSLSQNGWNPSAVTSLSVNEGNMEPSQLP